MCKRGKKVCALARCAALQGLVRVDSNHRPLGYEPSTLYPCATDHWAPVSRLRRPCRAVRRASRFRLPAAGGEEGKEEETEGRRVGCAEIHLCWARARG